MKTKEFRIHINAVFNAIDHLLSEWIPVEEITDTDKEIHGELCLNGELQQLRAIDTRSPEALKALAENRLTRYLKAHPDNSLQLFVDTEVKHAKLYKKQLDKYLNDSKQKTYYFRLERWIKAVQDMLPQQAGLPPQQAEAKPKKLTAPIISLFCTLINDSKTIIRVQNENAENYCRRICAQFDLPYTDRVRQNFDGKSNTKKNRQNLRNMLLPNIEAETQIKLQHYLDTKHPTEQNLYG